MNSKKLDPGTLEYLKGGHVLVMLRQYLSHETIIVMWLTTVPPCQH